jgi:hypothetical protein
MSSASCSSAAALCSAGHDDPGTKKSSTSVSRATDSLPAGPATVRTNASSTEQDHPAPSAARRSADTRSADTRSWLGSRRTQAFSHRTLQHGRTSRERSLICKSAHRACGGRFAQRRFTPVRSLCTRISRWQVACCRRRGSRCGSMPRSPRGWPLATRRQTGHRRQRPRRLDLRGGAR